MANKKTKKNRSNTSVTPTTETKPPVANTEGATDETITKPTAPVSKGNTSTLDNRLVQVELTAATVFKKSIFRKGTVLEVTKLEASQLFRMKKARPSTK